jgi:hypothetical protein
MKIWQWWWIAALAGSLGIMLAGCGQQREDPEVTVSWLARETRAAKPADCAMPTLTALPNADYQQIAIIEVTDDYHADHQEVLDLAHRKACETGADALVVLEDKRQEEGQELPGTSAGSPAMPSAEDAKPAQEHVPGIGEEGHKGWFFNGVAIIYKTPPG